MKTAKTILLILLLCSLFMPFAAPKTVIAAPLASVGTQDLINLINGLRTAQGLPALEVNSILMATAQETADTMAINDLHWHIGDVRGRVMAAGYGGGAIAWATENFAIGPMTIERIREVWDDPDHMIPVVNANYTHIGAGVSEYDGRVWYIVHAAYTSGGTYVQPTSESGEPGPTSTPPVSQVIMPVHTATPNNNGAVIHEVKSGQSLWSIAIAYDTKIAELVRLNNLSGDTPTIYTGQKLLVSAALYTSTPTPDPETVVMLEEEPEFTPTPTYAAPTKVITPTRTPTLHPTVTAPASSQTALPSESAAAELASPTRVFGNSSIGYILAGILALGVVLMIAGSVGKPK